MATNKCVFFDCDSTLSAIEGIDELARLRGNDIFERASSMTREAMNGQLTLEQVFAKRLELIRPSLCEIETVAKLYVANVEPEATAAIATLRRAGWTPIIISGGFRRAIIPLAARLGIERIEAVDISFDADGNYRDFDRDSPTTKTHGKNTVIASIKKELSPTYTVMVGDGSSDLETAPDVDLFIGFGRYVVREKIRAASPLYLNSMADVSTALRNRFP